jgi:hypothetical protein
LSYSKFMRQLSKYLRSNIHCSYSFIEKF